MLSRKVEPFEEENGWDGEKKTDLIFVTLPAPSSMVRTPDLAQKTHLSRIPVLGFTLFCKYLSESLRALALFGDNSSSETLLVLAVLFLAGSATFACFTLGIVLEWRSEMYGV